MVLSLKWNKKYSVSVKFPGSQKDVPILEKYLLRVSKRARTMHQQTPKFLSNLKQASI